MDEPQCDNPLPGPSFLSNQKIGDLMPDVVLNGKPDQEFDENDFDVLIYQLAQATDRLKHRSETMEVKFKIIKTRMAAAEAAVSHLLNRVDTLLTDNQALRDRLAELERVTPVGESDVHDIRRKFDILHQKIFQLKYEVHASRPWYIRALEFLAKKPSSGDVGSSDFLDFE